MQKFRQGRAKPIALVALLCAMICAVVAALTGIFGGFGATQFASAKVSSTSFKIAGTDGAFDAAGLQKLMGRLMKKETASYNELRAYVEKQPEKQIKASAFTGGAHFTVQLGGVNWNVTFGSLDTSGEVIATLWQADTDLYSQWHTWYSTDKTLAYPSNMYGSSFIRASLNGTTYSTRALKEGETNWTGSGSGATANDQFAFIRTADEGSGATLRKKNPIYAKYHPIVEKYGKYFDTPSQVSWQWYQSEQKQWGTAWWGNQKNSGLFGANGGNWWSPADDYTGKNMYSAWGGDKLWLPSSYETGYSNYEHGLWDINNDCRTPSVSGNVTKTAVGGKNTTSGAEDQDGKDITATNVDNSTWLRSGDSNNANNARCVLSSGNYDFCGVSDVRAVRPALHLNLKSAASAAGLTVDAPAFDTAGNTTKTVAYTGNEQQIALSSTPTGVSVTVSSPASWDNTAKKIKVRDAGTYTVTLTANAGYSWSDGSIGPKHLTLTVTPKELTAVTFKHGATTLSAATPEVAYTGSPVIISASATGVGGDGTLTLPVWYGGDNVNAGTFTATALNGNPNYKIAASLLSKNIKITPKELTSVSWTVANNEEVAYNGNDFTPKAWYVSASGEQVYLPVTLEKDDGTGTYVSASDAVNAGKYKATVAAGTYNGNYQIKTAQSVTFTVTKAQITADDIEWNFLAGTKFAPKADPAISALFRFGNKAYKLDLTVTDATNAKVEFGGDGTQWVAGDYTATAKLGADAKFANFEISGAVSRMFRITESASGKYTVIWEGFSSVVSYNGEDQKPNAYIIVDGEKLDVTVGVEKQKADGSWETVTEAKNAGNYRFTATKTGYTLENDKVLQRIDPRTISVEYTNLTGLQHGATLSDGTTPRTVTASTNDPVAKAELDAGQLNFSVTGGSNLAGTRVVSVKAQVKDGSDWVDCGNYVISNASAVQTVNKKVLTDNDITWSPNGLNFTYDGNVKIPQGTVKTSALAGGDTGNVYVLFEFVYAVEVGEYNVKVIGISNDNYVFNGTKKITISAETSQTVQWEGVQNGGILTYNGQNQLPKPYIVIDGEKVYLDIDSLEKDGSPVTGNNAILAGSYKATVNAVSTGNWQFGENEIEFTINPFELKGIYLTQNVYIYSGSNPVIEVYALGANNEKIVINNKTITKEGSSANLTDYKDAGNYVITVISGVLSSNANYKFSNAVTTTFVINPMNVTVTFTTTGNNWIWQDGKNTAVTVTASVPNAVKVSYGNFGAVNTNVTDNGSGTFVIAANSMTNLSGKGMVLASTVSGNYQISGQSFQSFDVVSSSETATAEFKIDGAAWTEDGKTMAYDAESGNKIEVSGSDGVEVKYYKDGVLLANPITTTAGLDAGNYLITVSCASHELKTNINAVSRSFTVTPAEIDFSNVSWVLNGAAATNDRVNYNGQIYSATLNLGTLADKFDVYYTNGSSKNTGSVTTTATIVPKNANYTAKDANLSYTWAIDSVAATVAWNKDGTVASITGDDTSATGGSFFEKSGSAYKVVYRKDGVVLDKAPTEAGDYTAEVVLALGNDSNVQVTAQKFSFSLSGSGIDGGETLSGESSNWWWIALIVIASLALIVAFIALIVANKKKAAAVDNDGFYDDVTDEDLKG